MQADLVRASCHEPDTDEGKGTAMGRCRYKRLIVRLDGKRAVPRTGYSAPDFFRDP